MNESNEQMNSAESTAKKPEKVASQRKEWVAQECNLNETHQERP
jgi:hypothetical protein